MIALIKRDILLAMRSGGSFGLPLAFYLILVIFVPFGVGADRALLAEIAPGILWIGALLSCLLSLEALFRTDFEDGSLDVLATAPLPLEGLIVAKAIAHWITTNLPLCFAALPLGYMLNLPSDAYLWVFLSLLIGTPALSFIGAFGGALTVSVKRGGLLLSLLVLPFYVPTLIFGADVTIRALEGGNMPVALALLGGTTLLSIVIMPLVAALALRANLR